MTIADILIWETTNGLLSIPVVHTVDPEGAPFFTERDRLFLFGHPCEKDSLHGSGLDSRRSGSACSSLDPKLVTICCPTA